MKKVLINVEERELRVAILEDEQLVELYIESLDEKSILNNIYKGRVEDVLPGLKAAFVNVGLERNAFLHFDDVRPDLLWGKYRELNPELADEVPSAREALAADAEPESEEDEMDRRKRRRGKRGGKKRRPDAEDTYSPGLPVGVTEDDLEDEEDDEQETVAAAPRQPVAASVAPPEWSDLSGDEDAEETDDADEAEDLEDREELVAAADVSQDSEAAEDTAPQADGAMDEQTRRQMIRQEKQRQRRERWEQKKQERQQRRQAQREERQAQQQAEANLPPATPTAYGTRGATHATDFTPLHISGQPRRNAKQVAADKARYGDAFGNIAVKTQQKHDYRDSQSDFFGPQAQNQDDHYSIWDEKQPNLGPVPGLGMSIFEDDYVRRQRGSQRRQGGGGQQGGHRNQGQGNQQNRRKFNNNNNNNNSNSGNNSNNNSNNNKRRGGKKRHMRKRDNRSFFALSADDLPEIEAILNEENSTEEAKPKKAPARKKAAPKAADSDKKPAAKKPAKTTKTATGTTRKKTEKVEQPALELEVAPAAAELAIEAVAPETSAKPKRVRAPRKPAKPAKAEAVAPEVETPAAPVESAKAEATSSAVAVETAESAVVEAPSPEASDSVATPEVQPAEGEQPRRRESRSQRFARIRKERAEARAQARAARQAAREEAGEAPAQEKKPAAPPPAAPQHFGGHQQRQGQGQHQQRREQRNRIRRPQFQEVFKKGDEIMVQVVKEEIGLKGARISSYVSLPGRYLVLLPYPNQEGGISRKVEDIKERKRLKNLLQDISSDETAFIVRTAGIFQEEKEIRNDVEFLSHEWNVIADRFQKAPAGALVYDDHDILYRLARDVFDESVAEIHIDSHTEHEKLKSILDKLIPGLVGKVKLYSGNENIFHKFGVTKQIQKAARRKVWLKSGGYLIIDEAEALTAIDVNTGKSVGKDDQEKLILRTNLESARAVARELKLRDIGGLIVIDFIDMKDPRNREQVLTELKMQLRKDRSKTSVSAISEFGLVEMTRKRVRRSLRKTLFMDCPYCQGAGVVLNEQQIWLHIKHEVVKQLESTKPSPPNLNITVNPRIRAYIDQSYRDVIRRLEQKYDTEIRISMSDIFHIENYQIEKSETTGVISGSATMPTR